MAATGSTSHPISAPGAWVAGTVFGGRYRLLAPLGAGAMGEVWRAEHVSLRTEVAIKLIRPAGRKEGAEMLERFLREARAAAQLRSRHVVQIFDHGVEAGCAYMAMELLEGETLAKRIERLRRLPYADVARIVMQMAHPVDKAHRLGIVHRDIKPANVFLAVEDGREIAKILDFGVAKLTALASAGTFQTTDGIMVGTPAYMSPEQVAGDRPIDGRSDLWQIAIMVFECVCGRMPFEGETIGQVLMRICSAPIPVPSRVAPDVPPGFDAWFERAAARDRDERFRSAATMARELCAVLAPDVAIADELTDASLPGTPFLAAEAPWQRSGARRRRHVRSGRARLAVAVAIPAALAVAAAAAWLLGAFGARPPAAGPSTASATAASAQLGPDAGAAPSAARASPVPGPQSAAPPASGTAGPARSAPPGDRKPPRGPPVPQRGPSPEEVLGI
ncbi:MAG: serine/threonine protein kinase [Deltaproteobacteria bacterium]|nr:serine/threonine protein kinase [Deltaproteobacteria bacterium]